MFSLTLFVSLFVGVDAGMSREEAATFADSALVDVEADVVRADITVRPVLLSALLCDAQDRRRAATKVLTEDKRLSKPVRRALDRANRDIDDVQVALDVFEMEQVSCSSYDVDHLTACFGIVPPLYCVQERAMRVQTRAAEDMMDRLRLKGAK